MAIDCARGALEREYEGGTDTGGGLRGAEGDELRRGGGEEKQG